MIVGFPMFKQTTEIWDWAVGFKNVLAPGQTIVSGIFKAVREVDSVDVTTDLQQGAVAILADGDVPASVLSQLVKNGVAETSYMLQFKATDSTGRIFEAERRLIVREIP
jgi:hypothetical protein